MSNRAHCSWTAASAAGLIAAVLICLPSLALAQQVHFKGETTADNLLMKDTLRSVLVLIRGKFNCTELRVVEAKVLPKTYVPAGGPGPEGNAVTIYEKWTASFCGKKVPFLIAFWAAPQGGTMSRVGYPF